ncbi:unnamed protein product [Prunus armeniaca]
MIRLVIALAAQRQWTIYQLDVKSAFLHEELNEEVFVEQPQGYVRKANEKKVYRLKKALYGLKQAPRAWYSRIKAYFMKEGFERCHYEHTLFTKTAKEGKILIVSLYVDDLIFTGNDESMFAEFKRSMKLEFDMTDLRKMRYFLGIEVMQRTNGIFISQKKYALEVLEKFGMNKSNPVLNPIVPGCKLLRDEDGVKVVWLRRIFEMLGEKQDRPTIVHCDSSSAIELAKNPVMHGRSKHINVRFHFLCDLIKAGTVEMVHCNSQEQIADVMTKPLKLDAFVKLRSMLGVCPEPCVN